MSEVQKVNPSGPSQGPHKKEGPETERFKEMMKQDKVSESDTEQKKKRKHPEQTKAEKAAEEKDKLEKSKKKEPLLETNFPSSVTAAPATSSGKVTETDKEVSYTSAPPVKKTEAPKQTAPTSAPVEGEAPKKMEMPGGNESLSVGQTSQKETKEPAKIPVSEETFEPTKSTPKQAPVETAKVEGAQTHETPTLKGPLLPMPASSPMPYLQLSPALLDMFERMIGTMVIMNTSGIKETVIHLNNPKMANSVFYGGQIVIQEHSTAPKEFNIQFLGNAKAAEQFQSKASVMYNAFQTGNYDFKVHRIESGIRPESIKRKGSPSDKRESKEDK